MRLQGGSRVLTELASGVDSLYFSGRGVLPEALLSDLEEGRALARQQGRPELLDAGGVLLAIAGSGLNRYPFRLDHAHGTMGLTTSASLPTVHVQPFASFIHAVGPASAFAWWRDLVELLLGRVSWRASRMDVFCDAQGWALTADDRESFVSRSGQRVMYERDAGLETLMFGSAKAGVKARIYDKSVESAKTGTDWWPDVWGPKYEPSERVLRVEFQVARSVLKESGIDTPEEALDKVPELWGYLTEKWLTYRVPTGDQTRSRWPIAPEWVEVQRASLRNDAVGLQRVGQGKRAGELRRIMPALRGYVARAGALLGAETLEQTMHRVGRQLALDEQESGRSFEALLQEKKQGAWA